MNGLLKYVVDSGKKHANIKYDLTRRTVTIKVRTDSELKRAMAFVRNNPLPWGDRHDVPMMEDDFTTMDMVQLDNREPPFPGEQ